MSVTLDDADFDDVRAALVEVGALAAHSDRLEFPVRRLRLLLGLGSSIYVHVTDPLRVLWEIAAASHVDTPVIRSNSAGVLEVTWWDGTRRRSDVVDRDILAALVASELAFSTDSDAWDLMCVSALVPSAPIVARLHPRGWIEMTTHVANRLEMLAVPGLFKISPTVAGTSAAFSEAVRHLDGVRWVGPTPPHCAPGAPAGDNTAFGRCYEDALETVAGVLGRHQGVILRTGPDAARRATLAALDRFDAWPALVLCSPASLWLWRHHLRGHRIASDARVVTYGEFVDTGGFRGAEAVVFDDLEEICSHTDLMWALRALDSWPDMFRIGLLAKLPAEPTHAAAAANLVRPGEFDLGGKPLQLRYPQHTAQRFACHLDVYTVDLNGSPQHTAVRVEHRHSTMPAELGSLFDTTRRRLGVSARLEDLLALEEISSCGHGAFISAKVADVLDIVEQDAASGVSTFVVTRHRARLAPLLATLTKAARSDAASRSVTVSDAAGLGACAAPGTVVFVETPWSPACIDDAINKVAACGGRVVVLYTAGSCDGALAARAHRLAGQQLSETAAAPCGVEIPGLVSPQLRSRR